VVRKPSQEEIPSDERQDEGPRRTDPGDQIRRPPHVGRAEPLEEKLLYPSGTQIAIFVTLAKGDTMRLDAVRLQIDGKTRCSTTSTVPRAPGPAQRRRARIYVGNVPPEITSWTLLVDGKLEGRRGLQPHRRVYFPQGSEPKLVGLTLAGRVRQHSDRAWGMVNRCERFANSSDSA